MHDTTDRLDLTEKENNIKQWIIEHCDRLIQTSELGIWDLRLCNMDLA